MRIYTARISEFTEDEYNDAFESMSEERKTAVLRMKFENDRKRSVLGEKLAREGIADACGIPGKDIQFVRTENGKPYCLNANAQFSISHCKDLAVCAVSQYPIGVDVEFIRDIDMRITRFACTGKDMEYIFGTEDGEERKMRFFRIWTAKEAYFKYHGTGISHLKEISYTDIRDNCQTEIYDGYMITVYQ